MIVFSPWMVVTLIQSYVLVDMFYGNQIPPPPPPEGSHNPLEVPVEWYVDVPTRKLTELFTAIPSIQEQHFTTISLVSGGDQRTPWARIQIFGKPLAIHKTVIDLQKITEIAEAGYAYEAPWPSGEGLNSDNLEKAMPVYHAAWTEFCAHRS